MLTPAQREWLEIRAPQVFRVKAVRTGILIRALDSDRGFEVPQLARELNVTRQGVAVALEWLEDRGLLRLTRLGPGRRGGRHYARPGYRLRLDPQFSHPWPQPTPPQAPPRPRRERRRALRPRRLLDALRSRGLVVFKAKAATEVARSLGFGSFVYSLLRDLVRRGRLVDVKFGTYQLAPSVLGGEVHPFTVATALVEPSAVSGFSALHYHGLLEDEPEVVTLTAPDTALQRLRGRRGPPLRVFKVVPRLFFGFEEHELNPVSRVRIFDPERALLDLLARPRNFGGVENGMPVLADALARIDTRRLVEYARRYQLDVVAARVGWALEHLGVSPDLVAPLLPTRATNGLLDPTRPRQGPENPRWRLFENVTLKPQAQAKPPRATADSGDA